MENKELQHWGILGMKWGRRRYQNKDGSLTPAGKKRYADSPMSEEEYEAEKQRVLKSGTAAEVLKFQGRLSNKELSDAYMRLNSERLIKEIADRDVKTGLDKAQTMMDRVGKVTDMANKGLNAYNLIAKVNNTFNDRFELPEVNGISGREQARDREEKRAQREEKAREAREAREREARIRSASDEQIDAWMRDSSGLSTADMEALAKRTGAARRIRQYLDGLPVDEDDD